MEKERLPSPRIPVATYRLQFSGNFRFSDAKRIVPYLHDLGITDIYASPCFRAKKGSLHGYDIVDPNSLNPEIGAEAEYDEFVEELHKYGMGQVLDIVPNHMCIDSRDNVWWMDVLENGPSSPYAIFFDIDWDPVKRELAGKVLLPVLGDQFGSVLERGELSLSFENGAFFVNYFDDRFPVRPHTYAYILEHRIEDIKTFLSDEDPQFMEYLSIMTALKHLPQHVETEPDKIIERRREKEVIKRRLRDLCAESREIRDFIEENVCIFNGKKGDPKSFDLLEKLLNEQIYRLSHWRVATEEINYRRFFDINNLAAIRMETPAVFGETHRLIMRLVEEGKVTGLRVDHPDGLYNPSEYLHQLQRNCFIHIGLGNMKRSREDISSPAALSGMESEIPGRYEELLSSDPSYKPFFIVGEKILTKGERMPEGWPIFSTTGYVFLNSVNGIFVKTENRKVFDAIYAKFVKAKHNFQDIAHEKKKLVMQVAMAGEINALGRYLNRLSEKNRHTRDFTLNSLIHAIAEVIACHPVYRAYVNAFEIKDRDRQYIELAVAKAKRRNPAMSGSIFHFLRDVLLLRFPDLFGDDDKREWLDFVMRFQQITGPVMAKGVEDTAFYVYNRLVSLNEVGGMPDRFGTPLETFHGQNIERLKSWPHALVATSTHDTKRSEDVRARINVLSEIPEKWKERLFYWSRFNKKRKVTAEGRRAPDAEEEYLFYQTLLGVWPTLPMTDGEYEAVKRRVKEYMTKAVREAKVNSSWINPDAAYEEALMVFIDNAMNKDPRNEFIKDLEAFGKKISHFGALNSLSQTLLKITVPGIPDFYQGAETWDLSLVDPDNRRPVDYDLRIEMLESLKLRETEVGLLRLFRDLLERWEDGRIKLYVTYKALNYRREKKELFERGEYLPIASHGERAGNVCAFGRRLDERSVIVAVPRFPTEILQGANNAFPGGEAWKNSYLELPWAEGDATYRNIFTGESITVQRHDEARGLLLSEVFANAPVALLEEIGD